MSFCSTNRPQSKMSATATGYELAWATLGSATQIGSFLFESQPKQVRKVISSCDIADIFTYKLCKGKRAV